MASLPELATIGPEKRRSVYCRCPTSCGFTVAFSKIDAHTYEVVTKKGGKNTVTARIAVAADGKTRVTTQTGRDGQGRTVNNTMFYDKQ